MNVKECVVFRDISFRCDQTMNERRLRNMEHLLNTMLTRPGVSLDKITQVKGWIADLKEKTKPGWLGK